LTHKKIVITGAPCTGKTVIINELEAKGYHCFHEIIRTMTAKAKAKAKGTPKKQVTNPLVFVEDSFKFNQLLLDRRLSQFKESQKLDITISFFDRGTPDVLAYMDYFKQPYYESFRNVCKTTMYDKIFILPPWKEIYITDNERLETFSEAKQLHEHLLHSYKEFGYEPISIPKTTVAKRISFILKELKLV